MLAFIAIHSFLSTPGVLGLRQDWSIPPYPGQLRERFLVGVYTWNDISSVSNTIYNTVFYYRVWEYFIAHAIHLNGELLSKILPALFMIMSAISMYYLGRILKLSPTASFIMGLFYMLTPVMYNRVIAGYHLYNFAYSLSPLLFMNVHLYLRNGRRRRIICAGLLMGVIAVQIQFPIMWFFMIALYLLVFIASQKTLISLMTSIRVFVYLVIFFLALNTHWISTLLMSSNAHHFIQKEAPITYHEITNAPRILQAIMMIGYPHKYDPYYLFSSHKLSLFVLISLIFLVGFIIGASILSRQARNRDIKLFSITVLVIALFFVTAIKGPFPSLWKILYLKIPLLSAFREVYHAMFMVAFTYSLLLGLAVEDVLEAGTSLKSLNKIITLALILLVLVSGFPILNSFMGQLGVIKYGKPNEELYGFLKISTTPYRVLYLPSFSPIKYPQAKWPATDLMIEYSPQPTFPQTVKREYPMEYILEYYTASVLSDEYEIKTLNNMLGALGVKYIVCRSGYVSQYPYFVPMKKYLLEVNDRLKLYKNWLNTSRLCKEYNSISPLVERFGNISIYKIKYIPYVSVDRYPILVSSFNDIPLIIGITHRNIPIVLTSTLLYPRAEDIINMTPVVVFRNASQIEWENILYSKGALFIALSSQNTKPDESWATDILSWYVNPEIAIAPVYGGNTVITWANYVVPKKIQNSEINISPITSWEFNTAGDLKEWMKYTKTIQFNSRLTLSISDGSLQVQLWNSTWGWKMIKSPLIPVTYGHVYEFVFRIRGDNAFGVNAYIREYNSNKKLIKDSFLFYPSIGSGTFQWKTITLYYTPKNITTRYLQLQIWYGSKTPLPLPNTIWIDYVKVYDITKYVRHVTLDIPFSIRRDGKYKLFVLYFKNSNGGEIKVCIDHKECKVLTTYITQESFSWTNLGTFNLSSGKHVITLENIRGFNAVNLFVLVSEDEYYKARKDVEKLLQNKTIVYLFGAESGLYREKAEVIRDFNESNGEAVKFKDNGKAWQNVELVKNGTYKIALKGIGTFNISIGNYSYILTSNNLKFKYTPTFYLRDGEYKLKIVPLSKNAILDVVWLYSTNSPNETLQDIFKTNENPATVQNYTKINPTLWKVKVNATKPFMLTFAESYDPLWEARVYKAGKLVEKVSPVPVYGVINGFWINQTGNLEIVLRYTPQDWFERGLIISLTTFILSIFYIFYDWRREKGDRWAKRLEKKIKDMVTSLKSRIGGVLRR